MEPAMVEGRITEGLVEADTAAVLMAAGMVVVLAAAIIDFLIQEFCQRDKSPYAPRSR